jgi:hypothetical protein
MATGQTLKYLIICKRLIIENFARKYTTRDKLGPTRQERGTEHAGCVALKCFKA